MTATLIPTKMRAVTARRYGQPDVLAIEDVAVPSPAKDEVLVRVEASSLNALDWHFLTGTPLFMRLMVGLRRPKRLTPGADAVGSVVARGVDATKFQLGDVVFGECGHGGGCGEYLVVKEASIALKPADVDVNTAAATPVAGLTALQGLVTKAATQPGERVLVNGAAGGVGTFAVQIAKALGANVTAVCSGRNVEMVRDLGADEVIDYETTDFVAAGQRFDVMVDNVGNRTPDECLSVLEPDGRFVAVSGPKENRLFGPVGHVLRTAMKFRRASQSFHQFTASPNHDDLTYLGELLASGRVVAAIDRVIGLEGVSDALAEIGTGHTRAKIVVVPA